MTTPAEVRQKFLAAVARGDLGAVLDCYQPDALLVVPEGRYEGREQIEEYYRAQLVPFSAKLEVSATYDHGDALIGEWTMQAIQKGAFLLPDGTTVPPSDKQLSQRGIDVAILRGGLIGEHRVYYDQLELIEQLGLVPDGRGEG